MSSAGSRGFKGLGAFSRGICRVLRVVGVGIDVWDLQGFVQLRI